MARYPYGASYCTSFSTYVSRAFLSMISMKVEVVDCRKLNILFLSSGHAYFANKTGKERGSLFIAASKQ